MATTKGPLLSLDASGALAKTLIYSKNKGRTYVKTWAAPANPSTLQQVHARAALAFVDSIWARLNPTQRALWNTPAAISNVSPFNALLSYDLDRIAAGQEASYEPDQTFVPVATGVTSKIITGLQRAISFSIQLDDLLQFNNSVIATISPTSSAEANRCRAIVAFLEGVITDIFEVTIFNLEPGTYWCGAYVVSPSGDKTNALPVSRTVTE